MEHLQMIPSAVNNEVFFDVTNAGYPNHAHLYGPHHLTNAAIFWPSHSRSSLENPSSTPFLNKSGESSPAGIGSSQTSTQNCAEDVEKPEKVKTRNENENPNSEDQEDWNDAEDEKMVNAESAQHEPLSSPKETQVTATLKWLSENYELSEGVCLPRCVLYLHYLDFCKRQGFKPAGAATFGKLIRQKFKNITTRRLGTRGQSKYHYYGIGIKESSIYYQSVYTGKGLTRFSGLKIKSEGSCRKYSLSAKTGTLLPEFPNAYNLILPAQELADKMNTFIMMYRTHSQRILDTVITANFEEIQNLLIHFWQGYPQHLQDVLKLPLTCDVVAICDSILYKVLIDVLVPNAIQDLPESLSCDLRAFLKSLPHWLENSLDELVPEPVRKVKLEVLQQFLRSITRQLAFIKMAQTARPQLATSDITAKALNDLDLIDFHQMCVQTSFALNDESIVSSDKAKEVFEDVKSLLRKQAQIESYTEWIDSLIDRCVLQSNELYPAKFQHRAGRFLLQWTMFGALLMKDLTLNAARSFSFLHLMKMTMDEYILLVMETQTDKHRDEELQKNLQRHMKNAEEIKMNAKVRTQGNKLQTSPKVRKRKIEEHCDTEDELDPTTAEESCQSYQAPPTSSYEPINGTAFSRPVPLNSVPRESSDIDIITPVSSQCESIQSSTFNNGGPLPISPMKHFPSYERPPYLSTLTFNSYTDYVSHANSFVPPPRQMQTFPDHTTAQSFHPMSFNPAVNHATSAPPTYWTDARSHHSALTDHYSPLTYNYQQTYDSYKKRGLLRNSVYQETLARPNPAFDSLSRANATLEGFTKANPSLDSLTRANPSFEAPRPAMYYARPSENIQVGSSLTMSSYGNSFMEIPPPSGQYPRQDGLLYQDDMFASNMAATSGLSSFSKSYLPAGFR